MRLEEDVHVHVHGIGKREDRLVTRTGAWLATLTRGEGGGFELRCAEDIFSFERGQGLVRSYFKMWDQNRQFIGTSYRWNWFRRRIVLLLANTTFNLVPTRRLGRGAWLVDGKGHVVLEIAPTTFMARNLVIRLHRRFDLAQVGLVYFLFRHLAWESLLPGGRPKMATRL